MDSLGSRRRHQLERLLNGLETRGTPELILACLVAQEVDAGIKSDRKRIDDAMAAAWAFDRATHYMERLRELNEERKSLSAEIADFHSRKKHQYPSDSIRPTVRAAQEAGQFEVIVNLYCVCVMHIWSLLKNASELLGVEIPTEDLDFLNELRPLRNHFEHWYNRLPGKSHERELVTKVETRDTYAVRAGLRTDERGRYVVFEYKKVDGQEELITHYVDLRNHSFERIDSIFAEANSRLRAQVLGQVTAYFVMHSDRVIPVSKSIKTDGLFRAGGID